MPCFCQNAVVSRFYKNILFLVSIIWSLLRESNTKIFTYLCLCYQTPCALLLTGRICDRDVIIVCILLRIYIFSGIGNHEFYQISSHINCRDFAVIFAVHRRSQSSTRENSSESRFDFNTPVKSDGSRRNGDKGQVHLPAQEPRTPQSHSTVPAETTQLTSRTPQNGSYFCE